MNKYFDNHFHKEVVTIYPGEFYSTKGNEMISTVLGSCVSVVLYDEVNHVGGINHFMLAKDSKITDDSSEEKKTEDKRLGKFGEYAIDLLIDDLKKKGGVVSNFEAKVFGGGNIFNMPDIDTQVGNVNSKFAFEYLKKLKIPVIKSDVGGVLPRKIFFDPETRKVFMKYIENHNIQNQVDEGIVTLGKREEALATELKTRITPKIELKTVKNLFENN